MKNIFRRAACFAAAALLIMSLAYIRDGRLLGRAPVEEEKPEIDPAKVEWTAEDGSRVISTAEIARDIEGFAGETPLRITIRDGRIAGVEALDNYETPPFFAEIARVILPAWDGLTPEEAFAKEVDALSGATVSSAAVIDTFRRGMEYVLGVEAERAARVPSPSALAACAVALCGTFLPLLPTSPKYRTAQLAANTAVLGFFAGTFVSHSMLLNLASGGVKSWNTALSLPLVFAAFAMPLLGRRSHYCVWLCPFGSLQELLGRVPAPKLKIPPALAARLDHFREDVWLVMAALMWLDVSFELINYEVFSAFLFRNAAPAVLVLAGLSLALSLFTPRPYCRFLCPTGTLLRFAQGSCGISLPRWLKALLVLAFAAAPLWTLARAYL